MKRPLSCAVIGLLLAALSGPAVAEEAQASREEGGLWQSYVDFWDTWVERVSGMDLYGVTSQLPQGVFGFKVEWNMRTASGRFDSHRRRTELVQPIEFGEEDNPLLRLDLGASGGGGGITMQFSYGLTDPLDFYFELPLQYMKVQMRPKLDRLEPSTGAVINSYLNGHYPTAQPEWFDETGAVLDRYRNEAADWFLGLLPRLGRPAMNSEGPYPDDLGPGKEYDSNGVILGDINMGFSWNYYRSERWSGAFTGRVYLPTGHQAEANNSLTLGTGPGLDSGTGAFGVSFTKGYDLRLFHYGYWIDIVLSSEFTAGYFFKTHRPYPDFPKPTEDGNQLLDLLDPTRAYFPDMSDLTGKSYEYTPGFGAGATLGLGIAVLIFDFGATIGYQFFQEPELNADWRFESMVRALEMQAAGHYEVLRVAAGVTLLPFYVPLRIHYQWEKNIGGRNTIIFTDNHWITIQGYIPSF